MSFAEIAHPPDFATHSQTGKGTKRKAESELEDDEDAAAKKKKKKKEDPLRGLSRKQKRRKMVLIEAEAS